MIHCLTVKDADCFVTGLDYNGNIDGKKLYIDES